MVSSLNRELFEGDAAAFLEKAIKEYVATSPANRLKPALRADIKLMKMVKGKI